MATESTEPSLPEGPDDLKELGQLLEKTFEEHKDQSFVELLKTEEWQKRFLKVKKKPKKAAAAIDEVLKYRKEKEVDKYKSWDLRSDYKEYPALKLMNGVLHGYDKEMRPVIVIDIAQDLKTVVKSCGDKKSFLEAVEKMHFQLQEHIARDIIPKLREQDKDIGYQCTAILDLKGFGMKHVGTTTYSFLSTISRVQDEFYPDFVSNSFIINSPKVFSLAWKVIKGILPQSIKDRIVFCEKNFLPQLEKVIDRDSLPKEFGGESDHKIGEHPMQTNLDRMATMTKLKSLSGLSSPAARALNAARSAALEASSSGVSPLQPNLSVSDEVKVDKQE